MELPEIHQLIARRLEAETKRELSTYPSILVDYFKTLVVVALYAIVLFHLFSFPTLSAFSWGFLAVSVLGWIVAVWRTDNYWSANDECRNIDLQIVERLIESVQSLLDPSDRDVAALACCLLSRRIPYRMEEDFSTLPDDTEALLIGPYISVDRARMRRIVETIYWHPYVQSPRMNIDDKLFVIRCRSEQLFGALDDADQLERIGSQQYRRLAQDVVQHPSYFPEKYKRLPRILLRG